MVAVTFSSDFGAFEITQLIRTYHVTFWGSTLILCNGPHSIWRVYFSLTLNKSTSYLWLFLTDFLLQWDIKNLSFIRFWIQVCDLSGKTVGFGQVWVPATVVKSQFEVNSFIPEVELLDHMVNLFLIFWGTSKLFSIVAVPIYILTNSVSGLPLLWWIFSKLDSSTRRSCEQREGLEKGKMEKEANRFK